MSLAECNTRLAGMGYYRSGRKDTLHIIEGSRWISKHAEKSNWHSWPEWLSARYARAPSNCTRLVAKRKVKSYRTGFRQSLKSLKIVSLLQYTAARERTLRKPAKTQLPLRSRANPRQILKALL